MPPKVSVSLDISPRLPPASADKQQVQIVFGNLVRNARDAMPSGGSLTIAGRVVDGAVEVSVADTGVGIPPEDLSRVMEPLYTTKTRGLGLGLAIARAILDKNRGVMRVRSEPGRGTEFTVRLPAAAPEGATS
jgi:two-component system sensor kinase FixL